MLTLIRCEGAGRRLWPLTARRPKALIPVAGPSCLERTLRAIIDVPGVADVRIGANADHTEQISGTVASLGITTAVVRTYGSPTYSDIRCLLESGLRDPLFCIAGDNCVDSSALRGLVAAAMQNNCSTVLICRNPDSGLMQVRLAGDDTISLYEETSERLVATGCFVLHPAQFELVLDILRAQHDLDTGLISRLSKVASLRAHVSSEPWFDIGSSKGLLQASLLYASVPGSVATHDDAGNVFLARVTQDRSEVRGCLFLGSATVVRSKLQNCIVEAGANIGGAIMSEAVIASADCGEPP